MSQRISSEDSSAFAAHDSGNQAGHLLIDVEGRTTA
jgi:hypothetical protein